jgi:hypothetical protein
MPIRTQQEVMPGKRFQVTRTAAIEAGLENIEAYPGHDNDVALA